MYNFFDRHQLIEGQYKLKQIHIDYELGRGNSKVYKAMIKGISYALKQISIRTDKQYDSFLNQIKVMKELSEKCKSMIQFEGYFITKMQLNQYEQNKFAFMIMECAQMNLEHLISRRKQQQKKLKLWQIQKIIGFCLQSFKKLEDMGIAHCDIKPQNILIIDVENMKLKLCDVGSCKLVSKQKQQQATILGTVPFLAPQLVTKSSKYQKMVSKNAFKSDVFSLGLVILYVITFKKFKSNQRLDVQPATYEQIINQWIWQARQLGSTQIYCGQVIKKSLDFNEQKRPNFIQLYQLFAKQKDKFSKQFQKETGSKLSSKKSTTIDKMTNSKSYQSTPGSNLGKSKTLKKSIVSKNSTTNGFKLSKPKGQCISPLRKRKNSGNNSQVSPDKSVMSFIDVKELVFITQENKETIPFEIITTEDKKFVLSTPITNFKTINTLSILKNCDLGVANQLSQVNGKNLYIDYGVEGIGLLQDSPFLQFSKIYANLSHSSLLGGYKGVIKSLTWVKLQHFSFDFTSSDASYDEILYLLDRLASIETLESFTFCWQKNHLSQQQHFNITQKISKIFSLKKLVMYMGQNFIECEKEMRWAFPKNIESLFLQYPNNFVGKQISNLCLSLTPLKLKQLYINLENNNLGKLQIHQLFKTITTIEGLEKLIVKISNNKLEDLTYLSNVLLENNSTKLTFLELDMHHIQAKIQKIVSLIDCVKQLFEFQLKHLKITCDRSIRTYSMKQTFQKLINTQKIKVDIYGVANDYFVVYLRKKAVNTIKNVISLKNRKPSVQFKLDINPSKNMTSSAGNQLIKSPLLKKQKERSKDFFTLVPTFQNTSLSSPMIPIQLASPLKKPTQPKNPVMISSPIKQSSLSQEGSCQSFYSTQSQFQNYQCLTCIELKHSYKSMYFCSWCIEHCNHKDHNLVKVYIKSRCCCSFSGKCASFSQKSGSVCAQDLNIKIKKQYQCLKCNQSFCQNCIQDCKIDHPKWIQQNKDPNSKDCIRYFQCIGKKFNMGNTSSAFFSESSQRSIK